MQNEELRRVQGEFEKARDSYSHLYDFAPVGYFTMNQKGIIDEANLTIASMLGIDRTALIGQPFTRFVPRDDQDTFYKHRQRLLETEAPQSCELRLVKKNGHEFYVRLECMPITNREDFKQLRMAVIEVTESKQAEDALLKAHCELERRVEERTAEFAKTNHELTGEIDERKRVEETLRKSEERYRRLAENSPDMIYRMSLPDGKYEYVSPAAARIFGYSPEVWYENPRFIREIIHPDSHSYFETGWENLLNGHVPPTYEYKIIHKDKSVRWINQRNILVKGDNGSPVAIEGILSDITERKRAEEALRGSEEKFKNLFDNMNSGVAVYTAENNGKDFIFHDINKAVEQIEKISKEKIIGRSVLEMFPAVKVFGLFDVFQRVWKTGKPEHHSIAVYKDERITGWRDNFVYKLPSGEIVAVYSDETKRKQAEEALRQAYNIINRSPTVVFVWKNAEGWPVEFVSDNVVELFGHTAEEFTSGKVSYATTVHPDDLERVAQEVITYSKEEDRKEFSHDPYRIITKNGEIKWLDDMSSIRRDEKGDITHYEGIVLDISDKKQAEIEKGRLQSQLKQSQKMEAIGTLAGGIAHDFNNILAIILGNAELASDDVPDWNPASEPLKEIYRASIRAKNMVRQLLAFSRKSDEESKPIDIAPIIKESMKMLRSAIPTSVEFKQHISDDSYSVMGDAAQINQIVMNLVTNAADAMSEEGGLLEMTLEKIILQEEKACFDWVLSPGPYVRLRMRDTGEGIEPKIMERIFDPYYTTKEVGKGTGMGLSVIHGIVKRHGGGIRVESELGKGTLFEIYFPALEKKAEEEKEPEGEIKGGSERILFVDDEESMVNLYRQRLERLGYQVKSTTKPLEALEWFRADPDQFDVIITDMTMPRMTGDRLAAEVLKIRPHMPVIICTGYSERMSAKKAEALGVSKYIEKPIDLRNLASSLREVLDEK